MTTRRAACSCGQPNLTIQGEPARISMCHCLECQRRTGAVISNQARFRREQVNFGASFWTAIGAPCDTPIEIVEKLNEEINAGLAHPQIKAACRLGRYQKLKTLPPEPFRHQDSAVAQTAATDTARQGDIE